VNVTRIAPRAIRAGLRYTGKMKSKLLNQALERVERWSADAQDRLAEIALDIDANLKDVVYEPTEEELEGIDRGLRDAAAGHFATDAEVEAAFAKFRRR
jgi:predicted transcriptional regulator